MKLNSIHFGLAACLCLSSSGNSGCCQSSVWQKLNQSGVNAYLNGQDNQAKLFFKAAIKQAKISSQPKLYLAISLTALADVYYMEMRYGKAETLYNKALVLKEEVLGVDDPAVAETLCQLTAALRHLGQFDATEPMYLRILSIREKNLGTDNALVANTLVDLTELYSRQGKIEAAELMCKRALEIREKTLGANHLRIVPILRTYASLLRKQHRDTEAVAFEYRADAIEDKQKELPGR